MSEQYSEEQWQIGVDAVRKYFADNDTVTIYRWEETGIITAWVNGQGFKFYMRDLVRGIVNPS